ITLFSDAACTVPEATGTDLDLAAGMQVSVPDGGGKTFYVRAVDAASNTLGCFGGNLSYTTAPLPTFSSTSPGSPGASTAPKILGTAVSGTAVNLYADASCSGPVAATGSAATFASPGIQAAVGAGTSATFYATQIDGA